MKTKTDKISDLKIGLIRQEVLPEGFILRVLKFKEMLREVETSSLEATISNFQRDLQPENELLIWEEIANSYQKATENHTNLTIDIKKKIFKELLRATLGV